MKKIIFLISTSLFFISCASKQTEENTQNILPPQEQIEEIITETEEINQNSQEQIEISQEDVQNQTESDVISEDDSDKIDEIQEQLPEIEEPIVLDLIIDKKTDDELQEINEEIPLVEEEPVFISEEELLSPLVSNETEIISEDQTITLEENQQEQLFQIEEDTKKAMLKTLPLLKSVSKERIATELNGLLCGEYAKNTILEHYEIISAVLPEIAVMHGFDQKNSWHIYDILTHTAVVVDNVRPVPHMRLMAFLHDIGKVTTFHLDENGVGHFWGHNEASAKRAREFFNEYKYDNFTKERVCEIIAQHDTHIKADKIEIKKRLHNMGKESFLELLELQKADNVAQNPEKTNMKHFDTVLEIYNSIIENNECFSLKTLALNGSDLIQNGFDKGKTVGNVLEYLLNEVIEEKIPNDKQKLLEMAKERFLK
jgi:HD superfamily phosphodiesterase